jgi:macrolide transport system ATP-binding/permease protein
VRRLRGLLVRLTGPLTRGRRDRELDAEIAAHLALHVEDNIRAGMSPDEARRAALIRFGALEAIKEEYRERGSLPVFDTLVRDARYAFRMMRKAPGFTVVAVAALALGISVNTTVFTAFEAIALRPLDVKDPGRLARIFRGSAADRFGAVSYADYLYYREHTSTLTDVAMLGFGMGLTASEVPAPAAAAPPRVAGVLGFHLPQLLEGSARPIGTLFVSGNYFPMLGTPPALGRLIAPTDDVAGAEPVVVLSGNFWQRHFHADAAVVGSTLHLDGIPFTIVGVTPPDYVATAQNVPDLWAPIAAKLRLGTTPAQLADPDVPAGWVYGRLGANATLRDVQADLDVLAARADRDRARAPRVPARAAGVTVTSGRTYAPPFGATEWSVTIATLVSVLLLLLIACTNVASLLLARAAVRRREIGVRLSLGASHGRLVQQLLTEAVLLALIAGAAGLALSTWMLRALIAAVSASLPEYWGTIALRTDPNLRVFAYTLGVSVLTGVAFGLAPALQACSGNLNRALKDDGGAGPGGTGRRRLLDAFVLAQVAACLLLLVSSALLLRSSAAALHADPGFETTRVLQLQTLDVSGRPGALARRAATTRHLVEDAATVPGVRVVARAMRGPLPSGAFPRAAVPGAGHVPFNRVSPDYFAALGIEIVRGRAFSRQEAGGGQRVAVISAALAARHFGGRDPLGARLALGDVSYQVVGVAADVRGLDFRRRDPAFVYLPLTQDDDASAILVRVDGDTAAARAALGMRIRRPDPDVPVLVGALDDMLGSDPRFVVSRIGGVLASLVAFFGLVMASLGVYGMVGYGVAQRTREIGIRMALGAPRRQVLRIVVGEGARPVATGLAVGLLASAAAARALSSLLFGVRPIDPVSFGGAAGVLAVTAALAIWLPARHATRVDPMIALRHE